MSLREEGAVSTATVYAGEWSLLPVVFRGLRRRWLMVGCIGILGGVSAFGLASLMVPIYRAEVLLAVVEPDAGGSLGGLSSKLGELGGLASLAGLGQSDVRGQYTAILRSRKLIDSLILRNNLLPVLFHEKWDAGARKWKNSADIPTLWDGYKIVDSNIRKVTEDRRSGLVTFAIEWNDAKQSASWANELVQMADRIIRQDAITAADQNVEYLEGQLNRTNVVELRQAIYRMIEAQIKTSMFAQGGKEYTFKIIDPAVVPQEPERPKKIIIAALGLFLGLLIGLLMATYRESKVTG